MKVTLYHGTTKDGAEGIKNDNMICGPAYFSPRKEVAADYAMENDCEGAVVICVKVDSKLLNIDNEGYDGHDLETALDDEASVFVDDDVSVNGAYFSEIGYDYED